MDVTRRISEMYGRFPYPSPVRRRRRLRELANLLAIFCRETGYRLEGKKVLDAGTGTGHRLIEAALMFRHTDFTAVDVSEAPLNIARQVASDAGVDNVSFQQGNVLEAGDSYGTFDMVLSMGVVQILDDPAKGLLNLATSLRDDGVMFLYIYGKHGSTERMRRKKIVSLLLQGETDFQTGIALVKELGFEPPGYGWNVGFNDEASKDSLIVDAYLSVHEKLYDVDDIFELFHSSGLYGFLVYGIVFGEQGRLFDTRLGADAQVALQKTDPAPYLPSPRLQDKYQRLCLADKYRLIDLLYQPAGYTLMGFKAGARDHLTSDRIRANTLLI